MIDRKALWISGLVFLAMMAAALWRLSLLPDWSHVPMSGPGGYRTVNGYFLLVQPGALLFVTTMLFARKWLRSGSEEAMQRWRRWNGTLILAVAMVTGLAQAFAIARSLGALSAWNAQALSQMMMVAMGVLMMVLGNALPKMPFLTTRFRIFRLDPFQWNRHVRFAGKLTVAMGLFIAIGGPLLPVKMVRPMVLGLSLAVTAAGFWHRAQMKREPPPLP